MSSKDQLVYPAVVSSIEGRARTIFTGDLSYFCTEDDLLKLFTPIGNILSVNVARKNDSSLMYGFVEFESLDVAEQAAKDLNRQMFMGRNLRYVYLIFVLILFFHGLSTLIIYLDLINLIEFIHWVNTQDPFHLFQTIVRLLSVSMCPL